MTRFAKRFFGKKRGEHNMRNDEVGGAWWAGFALLFITSGCILSWYFLQRLIIPEWTANQHYVVGTCKVLDKRLSQRPSEDGPTFRPEVQIEYEVAGQTYKVWTFDATEMYLGGRDTQERLLEPFTVGERQAFWYDPAQPQRAVVIRGYRWYLWLLLIVPMAFLAFGGAGLVHFVFHWGKSTERRSAWAQKAAELNPFDEAAAFEQRYPNIPLEHVLTESPGTMLKYRLPRQTVGWQDPTLLMLSIGLLLLGLAFAGFALRTLWTGEVNLFLGVFSALWLAASGGLLALVLRRLYVTARLGATFVEIDQYPWHCGEPVEIYVRRTGRAPLDSFSVTLECVEAVTYQQGTNLRIEKQQVFQDVLLKIGRAEFARTGDYEQRLKWTIPVDAMHSFASRHNRIVWQVVVRGDLRRRSKFERAYPVTIYPCRVLEEVA